MGFLIYLLSLVDGVLGGSLLLTVISGLAVVALMLATIVGVFDQEDEDYFNLIGKWRRTSLKVFVPASLFLIIVPNSQTIAAMYLLPKIVDSKAAGELSNMPEKALKVLNLKLDEWVKSAEEKGGK